MKMNKCVSVTLAALLAATTLAPMTAFADETPIEFQPYAGTILHNSADDLGDFTKIADSFAGGMAFSVDTTCAGAENPGLYLNMNWQDGTKKWGDGTNTTADIPDPYLTWQVTKGSKVDMVVYQQQAYDGLFKFEVSADNKTWTEVTEVTKTVVDAAKKTELDLADINDAQYFTPYDYAFTVPGDNIFVRATLVNPAQLNTHYQIQITKFRAKDGTAAPDKLTFDSEAKVSTVEDTLAATEGASEAATFEINEFPAAGGTKSMIPAYGYVAGKDSVAKPYVIYKVADESKFVMTAAMFDKAMRMGFDFTLSTSADKTTWTPAAATSALAPLSDAGNQFHAYKNYVITVPKGHNYVKIEWPQEKGYENVKFPYTVSDVNSTDPMAYVAGLVGVKYNKYVAPSNGNGEEENNNNENNNNNNNQNNNESKPAEPEKVTPDTTITFTGTDADLSKMAGYNKDAIDLTQKIAGKNTVIIIYDYLLGKTNADPMYITYKVAERSPFIAKAFLHTNTIALEMAPKFYVSSDNKTWTAVEAKAVVASSEINGFPGWVDMVYTIEEIPAGAKYVKVEYPQTKDLTGTQIPGAGTVNDPLHYGVAFYEFQFAKPTKNSPNTSDADFAVVASVIMVLSAVAAAYVMVSKKQHNN